MLSYQHIYHAGCLADVHKHAALSIILSQMVKKDKAITYMETHAGRGLYNLKSAESQKTREAENGVIALAKAGKLASVPQYAGVLESIQNYLGTDYYPGSPLIAHEILRPEDKMFLMELHPQEFRALSECMNYTNVFVRNEDGYKGILAQSPPLIRRGFVLIDPSYEVKTEYLHAAQFVKDLHKKWPETVIMLWYPILQSGLHKEMSEVLLEIGLAKTWQQEVPYSRHSKNALNIDNTQGSGLIAFNLPYGCVEILDGLQVCFK